MSRKLIYSISAVLIIIEISVSAAVVRAGEQRLAASLAGVAAIVAQVREYTHPLPKLGRLGPLRY